MVPLSFNDTMSIGLPWSGFTTKWHVVGLQSGAVTAFVDSFKLALLVSLTSTAVGVGVALACRPAFPGQCRGGTGVDYVADVLAGGEHCVLSARKSTGQE